MLILLLLLFLLLACCCAQWFYIIYQNYDSECFFGEIFYSLSTARSQLNESFDNNLCKNSHSDIFYIFKIPFPSLLVIVEIFLWKLLINHVIVFSLLFFMISFKHPQNSIWISFNLSTHTIPHTFAIKRSRTFSSHFSRKISSIFTSTQLKLGEFDKGEENKIWKTEAGMNV